MGIGGVRHWVALRRNLVHVGHGEVLSGRVRVCGGGDRVHVRMWVRVDMGVLGENGLLGGGGLLCVYRVELHTRRRGPFN